MLSNLTHSRKRLLEPMDRVSEILFGLIMVLTFTCSFSVANAGRSEVRKMLEAALGCNVAWGIIDGVFYLMSCLSEQGHNILALRAVRSTSDPAEAHRIIAEALPPVLAAVLPEAEFAVMRQKLNQLTRTARASPPDQERLAGRRRCFPAGLPVHLSGGDSRLSSSMNRGWPCASRTRLPS